MQATFPFLLAGVHNYSIHAGRVTSDNMFL